MFPTTLFRITFVFPSTIQKHTEQNTQNYNLICFLYRSETWSLTLSKNHRLMVFENSVLRKIFGPKRNKVTGRWTELHDVGLQEEITQAKIWKV